MILFVEYQYQCIFYIIILSKLGFRFFSHAILYIKICTYIVAPGKN